MTIETRPVPEGYLQDALGRLVPVEMVKDVDKLRDELVREISKKAEEVSALLAEAKKRWFADINAFIDTSAEEHGVKWGGVKGNVSLLSFDGAWKVQLSTDEYLTFDERLQVAKQLVDECLHAWSEGSRPEIRAIINDAFQVDRKGRINQRRILSLRKLKIEDPQWRKAMEAIGDSLQVAGSKEYIRIYRRIAADQWEQIPLDFASL